MTTIAEVARRAGVGVATVSRVLNRSPRVAEPTRERVLEVIDELGYAPNAAARALSTGRTCTIGVVAPFFTQPSVVERLRGVSRAIAAAGYQLVIFDVEGPDRFADLAVGGRLDGLLCVSLCPGPDELARFAAAGVPVALIDAQHPDLPGVFIDDVEGGRIAAEHLLALGHQRIAYIGDEETNPYGFTSSARRRIGADAALTAAGHRMIVRRGQHSREHARLMATELLARGRPPTAIFGGSDLQALGVLEAAEAAGRDVPGDLSVVGFDDIEVARYAGLTTIAQPLEESGTLGAQFLLGALAGTAGAVEQLGLHLVVRKTTAQVGCEPARRVSRVRQRSAEAIGQRGAQCPDV
jgi:LacI family transcriptional regulator